MRVPLLPRDIIPERRSIGYHPVVGLTYLYRILAGSSLEKFDVNGTQLPSSGIERTSTLNIPGDVFRKIVSFIYGVPCVDAISDFSQPEPAPLPEVPSGLINEHFRLLHVLMINLALYQIKNKGMSPKSFKLSGDMSEMFRLFPKKVFDELISEKEGSFLYNENERVSTLYEANKANFEKGAKYNYLHMFAEDGGFPHLDYVEKLFGLGFRLFFYIHAFEIRTKGELERININLHIQGYFDNAFKSNLGFAATVRETAVEVRRCLFPK